MTATNQPQPTPDPRAAQAAARAETVRLQDERHAAIVAMVWREAYAQWERGENASPSCDDLVLYAREIDDTIVINADVLFDAMCEGVELDVLAARAVAGEFAS